MTPGLASAPSVESDRTASSRIDSIDIFRGLTMAVMIFVNALAGVHGLPWWTYHAPARSDVMTYVDMVFPFFLFAVGLSLPFAVERRLRDDASLASLWRHVLVRSLTLVAIGLILANAEKADRIRMGIQGSLWALIGIVLSSLFLLDWSKLKHLNRYARLFQTIGLAGLAVLYAAFHRTTVPGGSSWIDFSYPEILGLIGLTYLAASILYIPTRRLWWAPIMWFTLLVLLSALSTDRATVIPVRLSLYLWPFGNGAMCSMVMAGVVISLLFRQNSRIRTRLGAILAAAVFALICFAAGWLLAPLGISKIRATPTWSLWSVGAASLVFAFLYWTCDVKQWRRWAAPLRPAGSNTLTTYLLPDIWDFLLGALGLTFWDTHFASGWPGLLKTCIFTVFILALSSLLTKAKIRLQL